MGKPKKRSRRRVVVTVEDSHLARMGDIARQLREAGMDVHGVMEALGTITGESDAHASSLKRIPGVRAVEDEPTFQIPPPDSSLQ